MIFKTSKKIFAHIDCDSFFASCEVLKNPKLKGKYVCVGEEIILACTYNVKALGIKTGTPIWEAKKILKNKGIYLKIDMLYYQEISYKLMNYLKYNTLNVEEFSIDEAFCEISGLAELNKLSIEDYIKNLQKDILKQIGIPVSIGVSNTRIKAKIFSKINKPFGYYISLGFDKDIFSKLPISTIPFIGKAYQDKLSYRAKTIFDFIQIGYWELKKIIGKNATDLRLELNGINAFIVKKSTNIKSMSRSRSFNKNITNNKEFLYKQLKLNFEILFEEFTTKNISLKNVAIFLRDKNFITHIYKYNFSDYTFIRSEIFFVIKNLFEKNVLFNNQYRSTGIIFSDFKSYKPYQTSIFDKSLRDKNNYLELSKIIENINKKYDNHKLSYGNGLIGEGKNIKLEIRR